MPKRPEPVTFADWIEQKFGRGIAEHFMFPYNEKIWTVHPRARSAAWCESSYIPIPKVEDVIAGAVGASREALGYNTHFLYPDDGGGIEGLARAIQRTLNVEVEHERQVERIELAKRRLTTRDGEQIGYDKLVSTMPLASVIDACGRGGCRVRCSGAAACYATRRSATSMCWRRARTTTERAAGMARGSLIGSTSPSASSRFIGSAPFSAVEPKMTDRDARNFYVEIAHRGNRRVEDEVEACLRGLDEAGLIDGVGSVLDVHVEHVSHAYVLQDPNYQKSRQVLLDYLLEHDVLSTGRYGNWEYSAMEDALIHSRKAAAWLASD